MNKLASKLAIAALCTFGTAAINSAQALAIFDFTSLTGGDGAPSHTYTLGTKNLTVQAYSTIFFPDGPTGPSGLPGTMRLIDNTAAGLGVVGDGSSGEIDNIDDPVAGVGDTGIFEWLAFSTTTGPIVGVDIGLLDEDELVVFWRATMADGTLGTFTHLDTVPGVTGTNPQFVSIDLQGDEFLLVSPGNTLSGFRVQSVHVPEPGTLALFGLGLAGLGVARRRKTAV